MPDGDGGFIINDDVLDDASDEESFSLPPPQSNGFIDFKNQFKVILMYGKVIIYFCLFDE